MPGPGNRKGRAVTDYESNTRTLFAPTTGSTWGGSFSTMYSATSAIGVPTRASPLSAIRNPMPLASSRSSLGLGLGAPPSQRSLRLQAMHEARQKARTAGSWKVRPRVETAVF